MEQCPSCSQFWLFKSLGCEFCESCGYSKGPANDHPAALHLNFTELFERIRQGSLLEHDELQPVS